MNRAASYDTIGLGYNLYRRPDPCIRDQIVAALGPARYIVNVGAGTGSYEPPDRVVLGVEPSREMIAQRAPDAAPCIEGYAESLPFRDKSFDAAMGVLTIHHWTDPIAGLNEMRRVADRAIVLAYDREVHDEFWLWREYFPRAVAVANTLPIDDVATLLGARVEVVPIPHDCLDGFGWAFWRRPERYLERDVQRCISGLARLTEAELAVGSERLERDLSSGVWRRRHAELLSLDAIDGGFRLLVSED